MEWNKYFNNSYNLSHHYGLHSQIYHRKHTNMELGDLEYFLSASDYYKSNWIQKEIHMSEIKSQHRLMIHLHFNDSYNLSHLLWFAQSKIPSQTYKYGIRWLEILPVCNLYDITIRVIVFNKKYEWNKESQNRLIIFIFQ